MKPFQQRVVDEEHDLHTKMVALEGFLALPGVAFPELVDGELERLEAQLSAMRVYLHILRVRIANFEAD